MGVIKTVDPKFPKFSIVEWDGMREDDHDEREIEESPDQSKEELQKNSDFCVSVSNRIFDALKKRGFEVFDISRHDGYFVFPMGKNSVVHFRVKGFFLKDYQFGMWIYPDKMMHGGEGPVVEVFQQHGDYIDKFKPSRSSPVIEFMDFDLEDLEDSKWSCAFDELVDLVSFMRWHPFLSFSEGPGTKLFRVRCLQGAFWEFAKTRTAFHAKGIWRRIKEAFAKKTLVRRLKKGSLEKYVKEVSLVSFDSVMQGCTTSYKYEVHIEFDEDADLAVCSNWYDKHVGSSVIGRGIGEFPDNFAEVTTIKWGKRSTDCIWRGLGEMKDVTRQRISKFKDGGLEWAKKCKTMREFLRELNIEEGEGMLWTERWMGLRGKEKWEDCISVEVAFMKAPKDLDDIIDKKDE
ncbi:MAG: hypothetical protein MJZ81_09160 [Bacteroidales bacterium]|nr:hypothetical protein [Bacteroidales bacterium]